jgi:hypothetical protein
MRLSGMFIVSAAFAIFASIGFADKNIPGPAVTVERYMNMPTIMLDGKPYTKPSFQTYVPQEKYFKDFADAGCDVFGFMTNNGNTLEVEEKKLHLFSLPLWVEPNKWDFTELDERARRVLAVKPDAFIIVQVYIGTPKWWLEQNKDQCQILSDGSYVYTERSSSKVPKYQYFASLASEKWRQDMVYGLEQLVGHIQNSNYGKHVIGYMLNSLYSEEWYHWSCGVLQMSDYSQPMVKWFRQWLKQKYGTNENLQKAWRNPSIDFDSAVIPPESLRRLNPQRTFRDPALEMQVIDYDLCQNDIVPDTIDYFAAAVKKATGNKKIIGSLYGYLFEFGGNPTFGHNAVGKYLRSPNVDFISTVSNYHYRQLGSGGDYARGPAKSADLHNKLWFILNDTVTHKSVEMMKANRPVAQQDSKTAAADIDFMIKQLGPVLTANDTENLFLRNAGFNLANGFNQCYFDLHGGYFSDPNIVESLKKIYTIFDNSKKYDRSSVAQVLVIADEASCSYTTFNNPLLWTTFIDCQPGIFKMGTPYDFILLEDLPLADIEQYKLVIFLNTYHISGEQKQAIEKLKANGRTIVWCYAPGLFNGSEMSVDEMRKLTQISIKPSDDDTRIAPKIEFLNDGHCLLKEIAKAEKKISGSDKTICKLFYVSDTNATSLGTLPGKNEVTMAIKQMEGWNSVYAITPILGPAVYKALARFAGAHIYSETDDTFYACKSYITISCDKAGVKTIKFPSKVDVFDPATDEVLYKDVTEFTKDFTAGQTMIIRYERK